MLDPLCLFLPAVWWRAPRIARCLVTFIAAASLISLIIRALPGLYQANLGFIALTVQVHLAFAVLAWKIRPTGPAQGARKRWLTRPLMTTK